MKLLKSGSRIISVLLAIALLPITSASAAPSLNDVRTKVRILQEQAAAAGEAAQQAKVEYKSLTRKLESVQRQAAADAATVAKI